MQLGLAQTDITPRPGGLLCGQLVPPTSTGVESRLHATALCLDDGGTRALLCVCDVVMLPNELVARVRAATARATGTPPSHVVVCATHTHSGPYTAPVFGEGADAAYTRDLETRIVETLARSVRDARDGRLLVASGELPGYAFNRRYRMADGTVQTHPLKGDPLIVAAEGPDSTRLDVLCAVGERGEPRGAAVAFGCHATVMPRDNTRISADYPGRVARRVSAALGRNAPTLFLQGASGNVCQVNPRDLSRTEVGARWVRTMGDAVADKASRLIRHRAVPAAGPLRVVSRTIMLPRRETTPDLLAWARRHRPCGERPPEVSNYGVERSGRIHPPLVSLEELFRTPFWADFYAAEILDLERMRRRQPRVPFSISVIAQDNWALVALPCELFVEWGERIRAQSPFPHTLVVELANGENGYVPTAEAFRRPGGYETKDLSSTFLAPQAGDRIFKTVLNMLAAAHRAGSRPGRKTQKEK